jgi:hypothetical protein
MIRGIVGRWKAMLAQWRAPRILKAQADAEYEELARQFGLITGQCLEAREKLLEAQDSFAREAGVNLWLRTRLAQLEGQYKTDLPARGGEPDAG